jgi:hypothetical protein
MERQAISRLNQTAIGSHLKRHRSHDFRHEQERSDFFGCLSPGQRPGLGQAVDEIVHIGQARLEQLYPAAGIVPHRA